MVHTSMKHRQQKTLIAFVGYGLSIIEHKMLIDKSVLGWLVDMLLVPFGYKLSRALHLGPINLVVFQETIIPYLGVGFVLRCFQRLSLPYIATRQLHLVAKPVDQRYVQPSPLVLRPTPLKYLYACNR